MRYLFEILEMMLMRKALTMCLDHLKRSDFEYANTKYKDLSLQDFYDWLNDGNHEEYEELKDKSFFDLASILIKTCNDNKLGDIKQ